MPSFRRLFEKVANYIGKAKTEIMEIFTGKSDLDVDESFDESPEMSHCEQKREEAKNAISSYWKPICNDNGQYESVQCNPSVCWCVDIETGASIPNSIKRNGETINCKLIQMTNQIQVEFGKKPDPTQPTTTVTTATKAAETEVPEAEERGDCQDSELCHMIFRNDMIGAACKDHADFVSLCPQKCNPECKTIQAKAPCADIFQQCHQFKSFCGIDAMITSGCPVTCNSCQDDNDKPSLVPYEIVFEETGSKCRDNYTACKNWKNSCHSKSVSTACPLTCNICTAPTTAAPTTVATETTPSSQSAPASFIVDPMAAFSHLNSFINSITSSFADKTTSDDTVVEDATEDTVVEDICVDIDPRCDSYSEFCHQENIQLLCPNTCQLGDCKSTTVNIKTTPAVPEGSGSEYALTTQDGEVEGSGYGVITTIAPEEGSGVIVGDVEFIADNEIDNSIWIENGKLIELVNSRQSCEADGFQEIRVGTTSSGVGNVNYFSDDYFSQNFCHFVFTRDNDDVTIIEINIVDVRTEKDCKYYVDVFSDDVPIGESYYESQVVRYISIKLVFVAVESIKQLLVMIYGQK